MKSTWNTTMNTVWHFEEREDEIFFVLDWTSKIVSTIQLSRALADGWTGSVFLSQCTSLQVKCHTPLFWVGRIMRESIKSSNTDRKQTEIHESLWGSERLKLLRQELFYKGFFMVRKKFDRCAWSVQKSSLKNLVCYLKWNNPVL